jgi:methanogenic corrinoid protein MtbC1
MDGNMKVGIQLGATDNATPVVKSMRNELDKLATARSNLGVRAEHTIQREIQRTQASYNRLARSGNLSSEELSRAYSEMRKNISALRLEMESEAEATRSNFERMATARSMLGIRSEREIQREIQRTEAAYNRLARSGKLSSAEQARAFTEMKKRVAALNAEMEHEAEQTRSNYQRMATAREMIGIRSEKEIQREIQQTEAAYNRLSAAGFASAEEQERALGATKDKVAALRKELQGAQKDQQSLGKKMLVVGGAAAAGAHYIQPKITNSAEYSMELMKLSNRVFHERDTAGRQKGKDDIDTAVRAAIQQGGGTVPETVSGYTGLLASQAYTPEEANWLLPRINMTASSVGADSAKVAELASSLHFFQIPTNKIPNALSGVVRMGQMGPVDADVIAEHGKAMLEQLGGSGGASYFGLRAILPLAEASALGAATPAQALTNATALVNDIYSPNMDNAAGRIKINGKKIKWSQSIIKMVGQGIDPLEAARTIVNKAIDNDSQYKSLNSKLNKTKDPVQRDRLQRQIQALRGVYYGKFFRNEQARLGYLAYEQHHDKVTTLQTALDEEYYGKPGELATDKDMRGVKDEAHFKETQAASLAMLDQNSLMSPLAKLEGDIAGEFSKLDAVLPNVTKGLEGLGIALGTLGAVGGTGIALDMMLGGGLTKKTYDAFKRKWSEWRGKASAATGEVIGDAEHATGKVMPVLEKDGRYLFRHGMRLVNGGASIFTGAMDAWNTYNDPTLTPEQKERRYATIGIRSATTYAGGEAGAAFGSVFPLFGTIAGGLLGSMGGYYGGDWLASQMPDSLFTPPQRNNKPVEPILPMDVLGLNPQRLDVHLYVDGQELHAAMDDRSNQSALRN